MSTRKISFSPPDITEEEINEVADTLRSGWITTGPKTKRFEKELADYCGMRKAVCLNSATACLEMILRIFDIGKGDEVITTPYTFAATANIIIHTGARPVFADIEKDSFNIDPLYVSRLINKKTKVVIPVDIGGWPCNYNELNNAVNSKKKFYRPSKHTRQESLLRPLLLADSAHSFGSEYNGNRSGTIADFTCYSFHAVKNLTTAEGGAAVFNDMNSYSAEDIYKDIMLLSLHGQNKDALAKMQLGGWRYNIECAGFKCNMTDIMASIGLIQLRRYDSMLKARKKLFELYNELLPDDFFIKPPFNDPFKKNSYHLYPIRIRSINEETRDKIIEEMAEAGIAVNVHFIPVVMHSCYKKLGFSIKDYPNCYEMYKNEISLPLYSKLSLSDVDYITDKLKKITVKYLKNL